MQKHRISTRANDKARSPHATATGSILASPAMENYSSPMQLAADNSTVVQRIANLQGIANKSVNQTIQRQTVPQSQGVIQAFMVDEIDVSPSAGMPTWVQGALTYHLNTGTDPYHVTCENMPRKAITGKSRDKGVVKVHYFFQRPSLTCKNASPPQKGQTKKRWNNLPKSVQSFVNDNFETLVAVGNM